MMFGLMAMFIHCTQSHTDRTSARSLTGAGNFGVMQLALPWLAVPGKHFSCVRP